jgi:hypothetical protein
MFRDDEEKPVVTIAEQHAALLEEYRVIRDKCQVIEDKFFKGEKRKALRDPAIREQAKAAFGDLLTQRENKFREILAFEDRNNMKHKLDSPTATEILKNPGGKNKFFTESGVALAIPPDSDAPAPPPPPDMSRHSTKSTKQ